MSVLEKFFRFLRTPESCAKLDTNKATSLGSIWIPIYCPSSSQSLDDEIKPTEPDEQSDLSINKTQKGLL